MTIDSPSALRMGITRFSGLEEPNLPPGYSLRTFRPGDEDAWLEILSQGNFGEWDRARLDRMLAGERASVPLDGIFFVTQGDHPSGTACTFVYQGEDGEYSELAWVAVHPEHRGQGLSLPVCLAVLRFVRDRGHRYAFLKTEDYRPAAIKTYLRIGFEPEMTDESHPARWQALMQLLRL